MSHYAPSISIKRKKQEYQYMQYYLKKKFLFRNQNYVINNVKTIDKSYLKENQLYKQQYLPCKRHFIQAFYIIYWLIGY